MEAVAAGDTAANPAGQSPLMRCVSKLNDDMLTTYLLPKLVEQGSVGAVALTCGQLRRLCQLSTPHLDLSKQLQDNPCHDPELAKKLTAAFPNCTSLAFAWANSSTVDAYSGISLLLAGLPNLSSVSIKAAAADGGQEGDPNPVLSQLCLHATDLQCLCLQLNTTWKDCGAFWTSLGSMTNLTKLQLTFDDKEEYIFPHSSLQALAGLTNLQSLVIDTMWAAWDTWQCLGEDALEQLAQQFPGSLTALTELSLHWEVLPMIKAVSTCVSLQDLHLRLWDGGRPDLEKEDWDALARLTRLTRLYVDVSVDIEGNEALYTVIGQLKELRVVGVSSWCPNALPELQSLTLITALFGNWDSVFWHSYTVYNDVGGLSCPHIRELGETGGAIPFDAFPNLVHLGFSSVGVGELRSLARHCTKVQTLKIRLKALNRGRFDSCAPLLAPLAKLPHLTHLELPELKDCELLSFTSAAAAAGCLKLQHLDVCGPLSVFALMQLQSVRGLSELVVHVSNGGDVRGTFTVEAVRAWLVGLAMVPRVCLVLSSAEQRQVFEAARQWVAQHMLPLPALLKVSVEEVV